MAKATALARARRVRQHPKPKPQSAQIGPDGPQHPGNRQLYDKRGRPDAGLRLHPHHATFNVATFCAALWSNFTLPLTPLQLSGQLRPGPSTGCPGFDGRLMHHHLAGLANSLFFLLLGSVRCIRFVAGQNGPDDPCGLVCHGDSCDACRFAFQQRSQPLACPFRVRLGLSDERSHANDQQ